MYYKLNLAELKRLLNKAYKEGQCGYEELKDSCIENIVEEWLETESPTEVKEAEKPDPDVGRSWASHNYVFSTNRGSYISTSTTAGTAAAIPTTPVVQSYDVGVRANPNNWVTDQINSRINSNSEVYTSPAMVNVDSNNGVHASAARISNLFETVSEESNLSDVQYVSSGTGSVLDRIVFTY